MSGAELTENVRVHSVINGAQLLVYVHVTMVLPPHADGATVALLLSIPSHPPLAVAVSNHKVNAVSMAPCV